MVKIYSDKTNKFYDSVEEANKAEVELKEKEEAEKAKREQEAKELAEKKEKDAAERKAMAEEVKEACKVMVEAQKAYREKLNAFLKKYRTYHFSTDKVEDVPFLYDFFDKFFSF
jgi:membrane protein involved in colicin uptake